jgi:death-on-curing protein
VAHDYLTLDDILAIHDDQIERFGGGRGMRDMGQLEAALFRPQTGYYADLVAEAAALWESLSQNHPFVDGNKRAAFAGMHTFLLINGWRLNTTHEVGWNFLSDLYDHHRFKFEALETWLRQYAEPAQ